MEAQRGFNYDGPAPSCLSISLIRGKIKKVNNFCLTNVYNVLGLTGDVFVDSEIIEDWTIYPLEFDKDFLNG